MKKIEILVITLSTPLLIGVYEDSKLINTYQIEGKTSDILPQTFEKILKEYSPDNICYVNGPGSYMAIKVAYLFLKTLCIVRGVNLFAIDAFRLNNNSPIKALGKKYFFKQHDGTIKIDFLDDNSSIDNFTLPKILDKENFQKDSLPNYNLPVI